jgi:hypothetical protein
MIWSWSDHQIILKNWHFVIKFVNSWSGITKTCLRDFILLVLNITRTHNKKMDSSSSAFYWHSKQISGPPLWPSLGSRRIGHKTTQCNLSTHWIDNEGLEFCGNTNTMVWRWTSRTGDYEREMITTLCHRWPPLECRKHGGYGTPRHLFWPFLLMNVPVGLKVQQCLLERTDRQDKSFSVSLLLTCDHPTTSKSCLSLIDTTRTKFISGGNPHPLSMS